MREAPGGGLGAPYIGGVGRFWVWNLLCLEPRPLAALLGARFVQVPQLQTFAMGYQRFAPLIYGEPIGNLHCSRYRDIPACPTRNSPTFTYGLRVPTCRMLDTTISSQSRQENLCRQLLVQNKLLNQDDKATLELPIRGSKSEKY